MFYNIIFQLFHDLPGIGLLKYITFRTLCAAMFSMAMSIILYPIFIKKFCLYQPIRDDGPSSHIIKKAKTPTMGGVVILFCMFTSILLFTDLTNNYIWAVSAVTLCYGILGAFDDYLKISKQNSKGIIAKNKMLFQIIVALIFSYSVEMMRSPEIYGCLTLPFFKSFLLNNIYFLLIFTTFVIVGSSNAVNLTDGLDGLVSMPIILVAVCFGIISYVSGHFVFANYLQIQYIPHVGELCVLCGALVGAILGFLWYNVYPAMIFMGDTGSLSIGGMLGAISVVTKHEFVLAIVGGVFVIEAISVMLQVISFKTRGKRIFKMAPIHHHFEQNGWVETQVVVRFWIISFIFALIGLATLKIR